MSGHNVAARPSVVSNPFRSTPALRPERRSALPDPSTLSWQELVTHLQSYPGIEDPQLRCEFNPEVQALWAELDRRVQDVANKVVRNEWLLAADIREIVERVAVGLVARSRDRANRLHQSALQYGSVRGAVLREAHRQLQKKQGRTAQWRHRVVPLTAPLDGPIDDARRAQLEQVLDQLSDRDRLLLELAVSTDKPTVADITRKTGLKFSAVAARRWRLWLRTHAILTAPRPPE
jgi:hypothetical protein